MLIQAITSPLRSTREHPSDTKGPNDILHSIEQNGKPVSYLFPYLRWKPFWTLLYLCSVIILLMYRILSKTLPPLELADTVLRRQSLL